MKRPRITHDQQCGCPSPLPDRSYIGWKQCKLCGLFVVRSRRTAQRLQRERVHAEQRANQREAPWGNGTKGAA